MLADESADCAVLCLACIFGPWVCMVWRGRLKVKLLIMMLKIDFFENGPPKDAQTKRSFHGVSRHFRKFKVPTKVDGGKPS